MKYETTHRARQVVNDAMDVVGGAGICRGPSNFVGNSYMATPIAITVGMNADFFSPFHLPARLPLY